MKNNEEKNKRPIIYIIAGPNGAGKTTFAIEYLPNVAGCRSFVNADSIARGLSPLDIDTASMEAGRLFLRQIHSHIHALKSFSFETTLSGLSYIRLFHKLRKMGYSIRLYYLWIPSPELALKRIAQRVRNGGHNIPKDTVKRRYAKGLKNLFDRYMPLVDYCAIFDNSLLHPDLVYERKDDIEHIINKKTYEIIIHTIRDKA